LLRFLVRALLCGLFALIPFGALPCGALAAKPAAANRPIEIRVVVTAMDDSVIAGSLTMLGRIGRADPDRLLVLRTASNYALPPAGMDAATSLAAGSGGLSALQPSLDAAFLIGSPVVAALSGHWPFYREHIPGRQTGKGPVTPPR